MSPSRQIAARLGSVGIEWIVLFVLWLLYVGQASPPELIVGAAASVAAAVASESVRGRNLARFYPATHWIYLFRQLPLAVLHDCWRLMRVLLGWMLFASPPAAAFDQIPFPGRGDDARAMARRALAAGALSLPPNTYVIGIDRERNRMLVHFLTPSQDTEAMARILARHWGDGS